MSITDQYGSINNNKAKDAGYAIEDGDAWISKEVDVLSRRHWKVKSLAIL